MSASDRLERLLYVLPRAAQEGGARIDDLARALDVTPATILADIEEATARVFYHPPAMVDAFELIVEGDAVRLLGHQFDRPARLTARETMALGLGLRVLAAEGDEPRRKDLLALAARLENELATPAIALQPMLAERSALLPMTAPLTPAIDVAFEEDDFRGDIAEAIDERAVCDVVYLKADGSGPGERRIAPVKLLYLRGHWYVRAYELSAQQIRNYRLDRILSLEVTDERHTFEDIDGNEPAFALNGAQQVAVRYSSHVARWVAEREGAQLEADGTLVLTHDVADMNWLVRHVLQYGGEAVVETPEAREVVAAAVRSSH